ncbi:hypothetical protein HT576_21260 [Haloterrigena sp. SYSU A121-1]|uniref:Uncharacterized protein n=1 Tax=Haloterrigena gelatinilytica TaxID=2741724 RepID=A0A8J8GT38_9EURY|nr:hypothetical protein [Haloterrigena gelatinilytica]NUB93527.1 hypothetical protein [Haloterrigena gelatinilytica]
MSNPFDDLKETETESTESDDSETPENDPEAPEDNPETTGNDSAASDTESATPVESSTDAADAPSAHSRETPAESSTAATADTSTSDEHTTATSDEPAAGSPVDRSESAEPESESGAAEPVSPAETGPAFEYSAVKQKPFYARNETVAEFENAIRTTILPTLAQAEVLDEETREIHDAVLRLANEQPERVAELVLEERRRSGEP